MRGIVKQFLTVQRFSNSTQIVRGFRQTHVNDHGTKTYIESKHL
jgi:hypothetical protein